MPHVPVVALLLSVTGAPALLTREASVGFGDDGRPSRLSGPPGAVSISRTGVALAWDASERADTAELGPAATVATDDAVRATWTAGPWEIADVYEASPDDAYVRRRVEARNTADRMHEITGAELALAVSGASPWVGSIAPAFALTTDTCTLMVAYREHDEPARPERSGPDGAKHVVSERVRADRGETVVIGTQYLWVCPTAAQARVDSLQDWYAAVRLVPPPDRPPWAEDAVIYSTHPGGHIDSWFRDIGGFDALGEQLPYLASLGANVIWLLPIYTYCADGVLGNGCPYGPTDFHEIEPALGGVNAARAFVGSAHSQGIRTIIDIVPHGGSDPHVEGHPEWRLREADGSFRQVFGWTCDYAAQGWQDFMADVVAHWARELDIDGYRVDVSEGSGQNLGPGVKHPSYSALGGPIEMLRRMREAHLNVKRDALFYPEGFDRVPFVPYTDISYGFRLYFRMKERQSVIGGDTARWAAELTDYLRTEQAEFPRDALVARIITNHDMDRDHGRVTESWGVGLSQAFISVLSFVRGVPFTYQEQEAGSAPLYARLMATRRSLPELRRGNAVYGAADAPDGVFSCLRSLPGGATLGLVNFRSEPVKADVALPAGALTSVAEQVKLTDAWSRRTLVHSAASAGEIRFRLSLGAWCAAAVVARPAGAVSPAIERPALAPAPLKAAAEPSVDWVEGGNDPTALAPPAVVAALDREDLADDTVRYVGSARSGTGFAAGRTLGLRIRFPGAAEWLVSTSDGLLHDVHVNRHPKWAGGPGYGRHPAYHGGTYLANRVWESGVHPLNRADPSIVVACGATAWQVEVAGLPETGSLHLDDGSWMGDDGVLKLFVLASDASPAVDPLPAVRVIRQHPGASPAARDPELTVTLRRLPAPDGLEPYANSVRGRASCTPLNKGPRITGGGQVGAMERILLLPEPGQAEYCVELPESGRWRFWLELRHSERAPDGRDQCDRYQITVDGGPVPLEWLRLGVRSFGNAYIGWVGTEPVALPAGEHRFTVRTLATWCGVAQQLTVTDDPEWSP